MQAESYRTHGVNYRSVASVISRIESEGNILLTLMAPICTSLHPGNGEKSEGYIANDNCFLFLIVLYD